MAVIPPCYDRVNHKDCPNRAECAKLGRSQCEKWVEYEKLHQIELEASKQERLRKGRELAYRAQLFKRINRRKRK